MGKSLPEVSQPLILLEGTGEPGSTGFPHLALCSGKVNSPGCASPVLDVAVCLAWFLRALALSAVSPLAWPFLVSLGYCPQKIRKWERKTTLCIHSLSCLLGTDSWSSLSGAWRLKVRDTGTLVSLSCRVSGLGEEGAWTENVRGFLFFLFFLFIRTLMLKPSRHWVGRGWY